ncbi:MAG: 3,5-nucleoside bisphosphate phosphatase [Pseudonocardiales bacterium]|jgi:predicted metal-dependent phosphoesterase TrpH|nr:3,5-nucleoside bisphosphate phosphatase [Pseudonocardiales bacterium]MDT4942159.1 3,5-nucleoside bisphosphate phosphatase [Pseudonocardiales bacterium]
MRIDLHAHSTASDGTDSPAEVMAAAAAAGLDVVALTDHDTTAGWAAAIAARPPALTVVPGVEFSCVHLDVDGRRVSLHLLAYLIDPTDAAVQAEWARLRASRRERAATMVENLVADGYPISWARIDELAGGGSIGRPHLARALVEVGAVPDVDTAFRDLLAGRGPYYVPKADTDVFDALALIRAAGGLPVFAHPIARRRGPIVSDDTVEAMAGAGLVGLEVDHPAHGADDRAHAARLAHDLDLIATGSSDYHGLNKPTPLGARLTVPDQYERLLALPSALRPVGG